MNYPPQPSFPQNPPQPFSQPMPGSPYPPPYVPPPPQKPRRPRRRLLIVLGGVVGTLLLCVISLVLIVSFAPATSQTPTATSTRQPTQAATVQPTQKATKTSRPAVTHGAPRIGGPLSDFYGKYGTPNNQGNGNSETWIVNEQQQIIVNAAPNTSGTVTYVSVTGLSSWSRSQTEAYCDQFLPGDASEFNRVSDTINTLVDYHSSIGEVVMTIVDQGSCVLTLTQS